MTRRYPRLLGALLGAAAAAFALAPGEAFAQQVEPTGKGIAGGTLLGAEVALITTAAIGAKSWWPYVLFGAVGAGGGAVGGYFVEQVEPAEPSLYMLAGGMALVVPTIVAVLNATAYDPTEDEEVEEGEEELPPGVEADEVGGRGLPMALIGVDAFGRPRVSLGLPAVEVRQSYTPIEVVKYGVEQQTEVHLPVVRGSF
jgi:hypothetical protein